MKHLLAILIFFSLFTLFVTPQPVVAFTPPQNVSIEMLGGSGTERGQFAAVDGLGNLYISRAFSSSDLDFNPGSETDLFSSTGSRALAITKQSPTGAYLWTKIIDGGLVNSFGLFFDSDNNIYVVGGYTGTVDFDPSASVDSFTSSGMDAYVTKILADGSYGWTKVWGGTSSDVLLGGLYTSDGIYLLGYFQNTVDFDSSGGTDSIISAGSNDISFTKLNSDGSYGWTKTIGSTGSDVAGSIVQDSDGNMFISGSFVGTVDFNPDAGTDSKTATGSADIYVTKFDAAGGYLWTKILGNSGWDGADDIEVDSQNNVYVGGAVCSTSIDLNPGAGTDTVSGLSGNCDSFVLKLDSNGEYLWGRTVKGDSYSEVYSLTVDSNNNVYLTGEQDAGTTEYNGTGGSDIKVTTDTYNTFLLAYQADGGYGWSFVFPGGLNYGSHIFVTNNSLYLGGTIVSGSINFSVGGSSILASTTGGDDAYLVKLTINTLTAIPTVFSQNYSYGASSAQPSVCSLPIPFGSPRLFQARATKNSVTIFIVPVKDFATSYLVGYGLGHDHQLRFGTQFHGNDTRGVIPITISHLQPNTSYFFMVKAENGCQPGSWGNEITIKTLKASETGWKTSYY